jgi:hypothetical protein
MTRSYPLPRTENDPRFSYGLLFDVIHAIEERGYPRFASGLDVVGLQQALFGFLYERPDVPQ